MTQPRRRRPGQQAEASCEAALAHGSDESLAEAPVAVQPGTFSPPELDSCAHRQPDARRDLVDATHRARHHEPRVARPALTVAERLGGERGFDVGVAGDRGHCRPLLSSLARERQYCPRLQAIGISSHPVSSDDHPTSQPCDQFAKRLAAASPRFRVESAANRPHLGATMLPNVDCCCLVSRNGSFSVRSGANRANGRIGRWFANSQSPAGAEPPTARDHVGPTSNIVHSEATVHASGPLPPKSREPSEPRCSSPSRLSAATS
jgi:hypothetical protein